MGYFLNDENITSGFVKFISENKDDLYSRFYITKNNGKKRKISIPYKILDDIQKEIYKEILIQYSHKISIFAKAYCPGKSIKSAVTLHEGKKKILCVDICDFFESITKLQVKDIFKKICKKSDSVADVLAELCTLDNCLPQGTSTSPMLSNFVCIKMDVILSYHCKKRNITYSRYADDMFFSGDFDENEIIRIITNIFINYYNFKINFKKVRVLKNTQQQIILGILVNKKSRLPKKQRREMRQAAYYIKKFGIDDYMERKKLTKKEQLSWHGKISYMKFIEPKNQDISYVYKNLHEYMYSRNEFI